MKINKGAFTLVELIVVIGILAILSTVGFISFSSYLSGARDTNRISQLESISEGLNNYKISHRLPIPDDKIDIKIDSKLIGYQGYVGKNVLETIEYGEKGVDPKEGNYFSYYLLKNNKGFQLMTFLEKEESLTISNVNAIDYSNRFPYVFGEKLGIITDENNTPIQEVLTGVIDITPTLEIKIKSYLRNDSYIEGTGATIDELRKLKLIAATSGNGWREENNTFVYTGEKSKCGTADLKSLVTKPSKGSLCNSGESSNFVDNGTTYNWECIGKNGGDAISCSANILVTKYGKCGTLNNQNIVMSPTGAGVCSGGFLDNNFGINGIEDLGEGGKYKWRCLGENGGFSKNCAANHVSPSCDDTTKPIDNGHITYNSNPVSAQDIIYTKNIGECNYVCEDNYIGNDCETKYLTIANGTNSTNLKDYIDSNAGGAIKIIIEIENSSVVGSIYTGDLTGLNVTLINNGEIQGNTPSANALTITSPLKLTNNGWIRGAGGNGGKGGDGKALSRTVYYWKDVRCNNGCKKRIWESNSKVWWTDSNCNETHSVGSYAYGNQGRAATTNPHSHIVRKYSDSCLILRGSAGNYLSAGIGGDGGSGIYFGHTPTSGTLGSDGNVTGKNNGFDSSGLNYTPYLGSESKGGDGGDGGNWGENGNDGSDGVGGGSAGIIGNIGGKSIVGTSKLKSGSSQGNKSGITSN